MMNCHTSKDVSSLYLPSLPHPPDGRGSDHLSTYSIWPSNLLKVCKKFYFKKCALAELFVLLLIEVAVWLIDYVSSFTVKQMMLSR